MTITESREGFATYLDGSGHPIADVGGKAAGLDWLLGKGYPVPEAAVITTAAYRAAVAHKGLRLLIQDLRAAPLPPPDRIAAESDALERSFLQADIPDAVASAVAKTGAELLRAGPVAVRSSATAEDLADASFAGQYLTITNVTGIEELQRAVRRCWASLWLPAARAYRKRSQVPDADVAMAVIVQNMVDPRWSGVAFTRDPEGRRHLLRIEVVPGIGESLVSGSVTPSDYLIRRDTLEVIARSGSQELDFLEDLARLAIRVEKAAGYPQDIEWAYGRSGLTLLQTRPITAGTRSKLSDGFDTEAPADATFTPHGVAEMLPGVIPPLLWTINAPMLENAFRATFSNLGGAIPPEGRPIVNRFRGRAALDLSSICDIAGSIPGGTPDEVERQYLGRTISDTSAEPSRRGAHVLAALRTRRAHSRIADEVDLIAVASSALTRMQLDLTELPVRRLVAYRQRVRDLAWRGYVAEVGASSAAGATYRALELLLERWLPEAEAASWAQVLTRGALEQSAVDGARFKVLEDVLADHGSRAIGAIVADPKPGTRLRLQSLGPPGRAFLAALDGAARTMGSQSIYGGATWAEDESWIWRQLRITSRDEARNPPSGSAQKALDDLSRHLSVDKRWRRTRILTGQVVDLRLRWLQRQVEETVRFLALRERAKNALLVMGGEERRVLLESERRLVASRQLPGGDLTNYLTDSELEGMLFGDDGVSVGDLEKRRAVALECSFAGPLPDWFLGDPDTMPLPDVPRSDRLEGWAASPGRVTGSVRIVTSLADGARLEPGDIMVAHVTDPSWSPLFLVAGGIVLEMGGPLAHAAIVAREFGLPAVLNVQHATRVLREGDTALVDGTLGIVERIGREGMS